MSLNPKCKSALLAVDDVRLTDLNHVIREQTGYLQKPTFEEIAAYMQELPYLSTIVISGGRISEPLDLPDFRSDDVGLYHAPFEDEEYFCEVLNKRYFEEDPSPLYKIASYVLNQQCQPSLSHNFIAFLEHKNLLLKNYTLNMDDLEKLAGITRYTQIYGNFYEFVCIECKQEYYLEWVMERLDKNCTLQCTNCASLIKPNILLFGEQLPTNIYEEFEEDMKECKLLIVLGSTLSHEPLAMKLREIDFEYPRVFINDVEPYNFSDFHFYCDHEHNDVIRLGDIDSSCKKLLNLLGWSEEFQKFSQIEFIEEVESEGSA